MVVSCDRFCVCGVIVIVVVVFYISSSLLIQYHQLTCRLLFNVVVFFLPTVDGCFNVDFVNLPTVTDYMF